MDGQRLLEALGVLESAKIELEKGQEIPSNLDALISAAERLVMENGRQQFRRDGGDLVVASVVKAQIPRMLEIARQARMMDCSIRQLVAMVTEFKCQREGEDLNPVAFSLLPRENGGLVVDELAGKAVVDLATLRRIRSVVARCAERPAYGRQAEILTDDAASLMKQGVFDGI